VEEKEVDGSQLRFRLVEEYGEIIYLQRPQYVFVRERKQMKERRKATF
jgi:hypothetical protein